MQNVYKTHSRKAVYFWNLQKCSKWVTIEVFYLSWVVSDPSQSLHMYKIMVIASGLDTVDSRYLEVQGTLWNTKRYPYIDISDLQNWGKK